MDFIGKTVTAPNSSDSVFFTHLRRRHMVLLPELLPEIRRRAELKEVADIFNGLICGDEDILCHFQQNLVLKLVYRDIRGLVKGSIKGSFTYRTVSGKLSGLRVRVLYQVIGLHGKIRTRGTFGLHQRRGFYSGLLPQDPRSRYYSHRRSYHCKTKYRIPSRLVYPQR